MSAGYFLYDWISCTLFSGTGVLENLHHLATLLGLLAGIMYAPLAFLSRPNSLTLLQTATTAAVASCAPASSW